MMPWSPSKQVSWDLTQFKSPSASWMYFPESHWQSETSSPSKVILVWGKARSHRVPNLGCRGSESLGWSDVSPKNSVKDVMHEQAHHCDEAANHQLPIAVAFCITRVVFAEEYSSLTQSLKQIHWSACSVILNGTATQYTCSLKGVYCPHWLVQWSHHCSRMHILVYSPWLPGYIFAMQTVTVILTMAGLFLGRPHISINNYSIQISHLTYVVNIHRINMEIW